MANKAGTHFMERAVILVGLLVGLCFYVADVLVDVYIFNRGTLAEEVLNPSPHEIMMRASVFLVTITFAFIVQYLLRREREIRERAETSETFLSSIFENIPNMVFIKEAEELRFVRVNRSGENLLGMSSQELMGKNDYDFFPPAQAEFFTQKDRETLNSRDGLDIPEEQIDTRGHGKRWLHTKKVPILDSKGQPAFLLGISEDITEAMLAKIDLQKSEKRLQTLFNSAADFIFVIDPNGTILETNRYACERSGYEKHELIGSNIREHFSRASRQHYDYKSTGLTERGYFRVDVEFVCKDRHIIQMECVASGVADENGNYTTFIVIQRDVTDKVRAQEDRQRQQEELAHVMRLSTMDEMASGIAHELNQPLTALVGYCATAHKLAEGIPSLPDDYIETLDRASTQAVRAGEIVRHLRDFLSKGTNQKASIVLDSLIQSVINFIDWELRESDVKVVFHPEHPVTRVHVDKIQIEQVLINLIRNSIEAISGAGITDGQVDIAARLTKDGYIEVSVADNGPGISPSMAKKLFEPYETSKKGGMGMGLGLSISRTLIEAQDGKLWADLQHQNGALFLMSLPVSD